MSFVYVILFLKVVVFKSDVKIGILFRVDFVWVIVFVSNMMQIFVLIEKLIVCQLMVLLFKVIVFKIEIIFIFVFREMVVFNIMIELIINKIIINVLSD